MKCKRKMLIYLFFIPVVLFVLVLPKMVYGQESTTINATIKISVCGNNIAEGGEDCDNADLNGKTCQSLGFGGGTLSCDISCSFNTSACTAPTPTPTPTPSPTPTVTPTPTAASSSNTSTTGTQPTVLPSSTPVISIPTHEQSSLPPLLQIFDINGVGKIQLSQLYTVVKLWVDDWKSSFTQESSQNGQNQVTGHKKCDINNDGVCDMRDFSVLMFYVEK